MPTVYAPRPDRDAWRQERAGLTIVIEPTAKRYTDQGWQIVTFPDGTFAPAHTTELIEAP